MNKGSDSRSWVGGNALYYYWDQWFDTDRSDLSSNLMQVDIFLTLLLFAINKAYF